MGLPDDKMELMGLASHQAPRSDLNCLPPLNGWRTEQDEGGGRL